MVWTKIRIDFTETVKCEFCNRKITSGKGIIIKNELGELSFSGPTCAQNRNGNNVANPQEKIIDITKGCVLQELESKSTSTGITVAHIKTEDDNFTSQEDSDVHNYLDNNAVKAYLTLRFEKLSHIVAIPKATKLTAIYSNYINTGNISSEDENYIRMTMYSDKFPLFTYKNLQSVYAAEYWLNSFIENNKDKDLSFIQSNLNQLRSKLYLTQKQIDGINKWFAYSERKQIKLKNDAFER